MSHKQSEPQKTETAKLRACLALQDRRDEEAAKLLASLKRHLPQLRELLGKVSSHWGCEDPIYRFYHQSFKVYRLQATTLEMVAALRQLAPHLELNSWFAQIVAEGTGKEFALAHNQDWLKHTRPIVEAFFHARYLLEMAVRYGDLPEAPQMLPSGWAAFLYLYNLR